MDDSKQTQAESCRICGKTGINKSIEYGEHYTIYRCSHCRGDFAQTAVSLDYRQEYNTEGTSYQDGRNLKILSDPEEELRQANLFSGFRQALKFMKASSSNGKLLDVGCGIGVFPKLVERLGLEVYALDPAIEAIKYATEYFGLKNTVAGTIDDIPPHWQDFNFITAFAVLEHLEQSRELAKKIYQLLAPGGYFIMSTPNRNRLSVKLGRREDWDYPPNHLTRWSKEVMNSFLNGIGFTNVMVKVDGVNRWDLGSILLPSKFNQKITRKKVSGLLTTNQTKTEFFLYNPLWRFVQISGDVIASLVEATIGKRYGTQLIGFAQKPSGGA